MTSSAGICGLIAAASPPRATIALRIAARSTIAGTPVKSCRSTRAGRKEISLDGSALASQPATARTSSALPRPAPPPGARSRAGRGAYGSRATSVSSLRASRRAKACEAPPATSCQCSEAVRHAPILGAAGKRRSCGTTTTGHGALPARSFETPTSRAPARCRGPWSRSRSGGHPSPRRRPGRGSRDRRARLGPRSSPEGRRPGRARRGARRLPHARPRPGARPNGAAPTPGVPAAAPTWSSTTAPSSRCASPAATRPPRGPPASRRRSRGGPGPWLSSRRGRPVRNTQHLGVFRSRSAVGNRTRDAPQFSQHGRGKKRKPGRVPVAPRPAKKEATPFFTRRRVAVAVAAAAVAVVLIGASLLSARDDGDDGGATTAITGGADVEALLDGIPQSGTVLGEDRRRRHARRVR